MRSDRLLLEDILDAATEVIESMPPTQVDFDADKFCRSHLLRHIQIVGEAAHRLSQTIKDQHLDVPWRQMAGMRHVLVHDYFEVNWTRVYETACRDIPAVKVAVQAILDSLPPNVP